MDAQRRLRILCADDNALLGEAMLCVLNHTGYVAEHVADGLEAWDTLSKDIDHFDVLVTDHEMPGLNGLELVELLRQANYSGRIIVHTSGVEPDVADRYHALGVEAIVLKSSTAGKLLRAIQAPVHQ